MSQNTTTNGLIAAKRGLALSAEIAADFDRRASEARAAGDGRTAAVYEAHADRARREAKDYQSIVDRILDERDRRYDMLLDGREAEAGDLA